MADDLSIPEAFHKVEQLIENDQYDESIPILKHLQERVAQAALFSENEGLSDVSTSSLPLLRLDHVLAISLTRQSGTDLNDRLSRLKLACDLWENFLQRLESLELVEKMERDEMTKLFEYMEASNEGEVPFLQISREMKIERLKVQQQIKTERQKLTALHERRTRLGISSEEEMDGYDDEGLQRETEVKALQLAKLEALEELGNTIREIPMLKRMTSEGPTRDDRRPQPPPQNKGLKLTHINKDPTGKITVREELRQQVFRPGWNQPTMSLEELAEIEVREAQERAEKQKTAEEQNKDAPRRYKQLEKDGMEDRADLVDASAELDRKWDDWKDDNPRGSGNKRGDVGDRNF